MNKAIAGMLTAAAITTASVSIADASTLHGVRRVPTGLTNHRLNVVEAELDAKGIGFKTVGGGIFGIVIKSDWGVCATQPGAGQPVHGPIKLIVAHFSCGA